MMISGLPLQALLAKMRASTTGFNANLAEVATSVYGVKPFTIDWPTDPFQKSTNTFVLGKIPPEEIDSFGTTGATKATMFIDKSVNVNFEKPRDFSGMVYVGLDFHISYLTSDMRQNFEATMMAVEDAFAETVQPDLQQNWGGGVVYNGQFSAIRGMVYDPESKGQGALRQLLAFRLEFMVNV